MLFFLLRIHRSVQQPTQGRWPFSWLLSATFRLFPSRCHLADLHFISVIPHFPTPASFLPTSLEHQMSFIKLAWANDESGALQWLAAKWQHGELLRDSPKVAERSSLFYLVTFCQHALRAISHFRLPIGPKCRMKYEYCTSVEFSLHLLRCFPFTAA